MFFPGSFIWNRLSDEWLLTTTASFLLGAAALIVALVTASMAFVPIDGAGMLTNLFWAVAGVSAGISVFFLWGGMWRYWISVDSSSRTARGIWFAVMTAGVWFGAILYYVCVYLPEIRRRRGASVGKVAG
jgi:hypothetical protein